MNQNEPNSPLSGKRVMSLDVFRGIIMVSMLMGTLGMQKLAHLPVVGFVYTQLTHAPWRGFHFEDLILPSFLFIIGIAMALSLEKRRGRGEDSRVILGHSIRRFIALFCLGFLLSWISSGKPYYGAGVLQVLAFSYLIAYPFFDRSMKDHWAGFGGLLFIYWLFIFIVPVPEEGRNSYVIYKNLVYFIDDTVTGSATRWGYLYTLITSAAVIVYGGIVGKLLSKRDSHGAFMKTLVAYGVAGVLTGLALNPFIPIIKRMFTPSYTLFTCGLATLLFIAVYWIVDVKGSKKWAFPFVVIGMNSIFIYMLNDLLGGWFTTTAGVLLVPVAGLLGSWTLPLQHVMRLLAEGLVCLWLYRHRIFIKL